MIVTLTTFIDKPVVDIFGGASGLFAGKVPSIRHLVDSRNSDAYVCPHDLLDIWGEKPYLEYLRTLSREKPLFLFNRGDFPKHFCSPGIISLQTSIESGIRCDRHQTIIVPYNIKLSTPFSPRPYKGAPIISFMGYVPKMTIGRFARSLWPLPPNLVKRNGAIIRRCGLKQISKFEDSIVISRPDYSGSHKAHYANPKLRTSYEDSIMKSDLVFSPRGDGNTSQRFYEALSVGRTPIIPDSEMVFPKVKNDGLENCLIMVSSLSRNIEGSIKQYWDQFSAITYLEHQERLVVLYKTQYLYSKFMLSLFESDIKDIRTFAF